MLRFMRLSPGNFPLILEWLAEPHVKEWWNDGDDTLEKVTAHYGAQDNTQRFMLLDDEKPIGYFQYYFDGDAIGIDQFIGDKNYLNRGVGKQAIEIFISMIAEKHRPPYIFLDPSPDNKRAVRCYEKVGFKHYQTVENEGGQQVYIMRLDTFSTEYQTKL